MCRGRWFEAGLANILFAAALLIWSQPAAAQAPTPPQPSGVKCNLLHDHLPKPGVNDPTSSDPDHLTPIDLTTRDMILKSGLPCDAINTDQGPNKLPIANRQRGFDFYSWLTFIALNSPAEDPQHRGIAGSRPDTPTVWESGMFKPLLDVMLASGEKPDWNTPVIPPACQSLHALHPNRMVVKMIEESFNEPFKTGPLIDQHNNYAIFDILMNRAMFDYIVDDKHPLYSQAKQSSDQNAALRIDFPAGQQDKTGAGDPGSIMLKVSWKILTDRDDENKFHHVDALVAMPASSDETGEPPCLERTLGLVGMHIVHKTVSRPQWIWTSFEHVDNVPEQRDVDAHNLRRAYNFYDPSCSKENCPVNETPPRPWDPEYANALQFRRTPDGKMLFNSQITRVVPLTDETTAINGQFQYLLSDTVWKHYIMIGTQWPSLFPCTADHSGAPGVVPPKTDFDKQPDMNCAPAPTFLANSTLETFSQGKIPQASSSCMACHGNATSFLRRSANAATDPKEKFMNQSDFTFMLEKARGPAPSR